MEAGIQKNTGIEQLLRNTPKVETEKKLSVEEYSLPFMQVVQQYESYLKLAEKLHLFICTERIDTVLSPQEIDAFLQNTLNFSGDHRYSTAYFVNRLIRNSYAAGNNNFVLYSSEGMLSGLGHHLQGEKDRPLCIQVYGTVDDIEIEGGRFLSFEMKGHTKSLTLGFLSDSYSYFNGVGEMRRTLYRGRDYDPKSSIIDNCSFATGNKKTLALYKRQGLMSNEIDDGAYHTRFRPSGNKLIFMGKNEKPKVLEKW